MAIILVVDDHAIDRELLVTLLGYSGHRMLEAGDGTEALEMARVERPNLNISDILMPTIDGYEFVRQLRADPSIANTAIILYTANYRQREGLAIAQACGVSHLLVKPCDPAAILRTVETVLHDSMRNIPQLPSETMWTWQTPLPSEQPTHRWMSKIMIDDLLLMALIEFRQQLASEHHPQRLLEGFCKAARDLIGARLAITGILGKDPHALLYFAVNGLSSDQQSQLVPPPPRQALLGRLLDTRGALRLHAADDALQTLSFLLLKALPIRSLLGVPIVSPRQLYGWLCLFDKLGLAVFTEDNELLAATLATEVAMAYENAMLYRELQGYTGELEQEVRERKRAEAALQETEARPIGSSTGTGRRADR
jgi:two-component system cell cycle sensor histidine kinase/response regulator CckA